MDGYAAARETLIADGEPGVESAEELCDLTDEAVSALAEAASGRAPKRWAVVALGGWGAGRLLPASDLDLLVLCDEPAAKVRPFVEAVLYPLWDAGLAVGHQVRSRRQQLAAVRADIDTLTATLNGRVVCGDRDWAEGMLAECAADARRRSRDVLRSLAARPRPGSPYQLEADLKDGAGGQRDLDEVGWTASILAGRMRAGFGALVDEGIIDSAEESRLVAAAEKIAAARWDLQRARPRSGSLLSLDAVEDVRIDAEMVTAGMADAHHILLAVRRRLAGGRPPDLRPLASPRLFELLDRGEAALPDLEEAAWDGRLESLVPGIRTLMAVRRPGIGHALTVGAHTLRAAVLAGTLADAGDPDAPLAHSRAALTDLRVVQVAALAHDLGKASGGPGHAERGAPLARDIARRLQLDDEEATAAETLVREHLLLAETAATRDIGDEDVLLGTAARIGARDLVPALHLLTAADSMSTGPGAWTPWHAALVGTLVARLDAALAPEIDGAGLAVRGESVRGAALAKLPDGAARAFVEHAPLRYLASRAFEAVVADAKLAAGLASSPDGAPASAVRPGPLSGSFEVSIAAPDRPELFARAAGALTLTGLDILGAEAWTAPGGTALDTFTVRSATRAAVPPDAWSALDRALTAALTDRFDLTTRIRQRARDYAHAAVTSRATRARTRVTFDASAGWALAVTVRAPDRAGLLHDLAREIAAEGLDIRRANVVTRDGLALDTFHVVDASGQAPDDPGVLGHLSMRLRSAV